MEVFINLTWWLRTAIISVLVVKIFLGMSPTSQNSPVVRRPPKRGKATSGDGNGVGVSPMSLRAQPPQKRACGTRKELFPQCGKQQTANYNKPLNLPGIS